MQRETARHAEAFEYYYSLGDDRSYREVAAKFQVSETAVKKWSHGFDWQLRIEQRDIEVAKKLAKQTVTTVVNEKAQYRRIIKSVIADTVRKQLDPNEKDKPLKIQSVTDLEKLVKLDLLLMGEETDRVGAIHSGEITNHHDLAEWIKGDDDAKSLVRELHRRRTAGLRKGSGNG